jgi:hypothetical protein
MGWMERERALGRMRELGLVQLVCCPGLDGATGPVGVLEVGAR